MKEPIYFDIKVRRVNRLQERSSFMSFKKITKVLNKQKANVALSAVLILALAVFVVSPALATAPVSQTSIDILDIDPTLDGCLIVGTEITVSGTATADAPPGQLSQYHVQLDWGDGNTDDQTEASAFGVGNAQGVATRIFSGSHTYSAAGSITITARIYHQTAPGSDGDADAAESTQICVIEPDTATLTLEKTVVNDDSGTAVDTDWTLSASGPTNISGNEGDASVTSATVDVGTYNLSESGGPAGYTASAWVCTGVTQDDADTVTLADGNDVTCTITNDDNDPTQGSVTVTKVVTNDNSGTSVVADFTLKVGQTTVTSGAANNFDPATYVISESGPGGYTASYFGACDNQNHEITVVAGESYSCTITNNDNPPPPPTQNSLTVTKVVVNNDGGTAVVSDFTLKVGQTTVVSGASNNFDFGAYVVSESGGPGGYSSAITGDCDANGNVTLIEDHGPYSCTITNNDIAREGNPSADVGIEKTVSDASPDHDQNVTYTITVTNHGPDADNNISVNDDLPSGVSFVSANASEGSYDEVSGVWSGISLASGESATLTINVNVDASSGDKVTNEACIFLNDEVDIDNNSQNDCDSVDLTVHRKSSGGGSSGGGSRTPPPPPVTQVFPPQIAGATTELPRTGNSAGYLMSLMVLAFAPFAIKRSKKA